MKKPVQAKILAQRSRLCFKFIDLLKSQITNPKKQINNNDQNSKSQTKEQSLCLWPGGNRFGI
jgi:hypothetical protein